MNSQYMLRKAIKADHWAIKRLIWKEKLNPSGLDWKRFTVVVSASGQVVGCSQIKPHYDGSHELASMVVHPAYRDQGIARMIIEHQLNSTDDDLYLICQSELINFYEKFGFIKISKPEMPIFFRRLSDLPTFFTHLSKVQLLIMRRRMKRK
jgi:N-acetylglutamate synthase-like GNAT family acetyltransferase